MAMTLKEVQTTYNNQAIKLPQFLDASKKGFKLPGDSGGVEYASDISIYGVTSPTDIKAFALAGLIWLGKGTETNISSFENSQLTTKTQWELR